MSNRGRPRMPGVLTPREEEVLALIKAGLSNREIAERLDISLAGAKFHVSEIIGKLGVSSREEAAAWEPERQEVLLPWQAALMPKILGAGLLAVVTFAVFGFASLGWGQEHADSLRAVASGTPTPQAHSAEQTDPNWLFAHPQRFTSIQDATTEASFQPQLPAYIPAGFQIASIEFIRFPTNPPGRKDIHNDLITV